MKPKRKFIRSLIADGCFLAGLVSIVVGIAVAGYGPLAIAVAGLELAVVGVMMGAANGEEDADDRR